MKHILKITLLLLTSLNLFSQQDSTTTVKDTIRVNVGRTQILIIDEDDEIKITEGDKVDEEETRREKTKRLTHWTGIDLGVNGFSFGADPVDIESGDYDYFDLELGHSRSISFNVYEEKLRIVGDYFGVFTGLGFEINNYALRNDYTLQSNKDTVFAIMDTTISLRKNKFRTTWVNVPLMVEFNTSDNTDSNFHLAAGVVGGWRLSTKYKQKFKRNGNRERSKTNKSFNVMDYKLDATLRLGYRDFTLFATYSLTPLFDEGKTVEIHPFTVGIQLVGF